MNILIGALIGFLYSLLSVSSMILIARYVLLKGWWYGISAAIGSLLSQAVYAVLALIALTVLHIHMYSGASGTHSAINQLYMIIPSMALIFFIAYKIYKAPMPKENKLETMSIFKPFLVLLVVTISRPMRLIGYMAIIAGFAAGLGGLTLNRGIELVVGMSVGVVVWWLLLVTIVFALRKKVTPDGVYKFSKIGAVVLCFVAFLPLLSLL